MEPLQSLFDIEARMPSGEGEGISNNEYLHSRLKQLSQESQPPECVRDFMSLAQTRDYIDRQYQSNAAFTDIPHLPQIEYSDDELRLWTSLIADYRTVASQVPRYTNIMVWSGVPPPLRGLTWKSMCESYSQTFESLYDSLAEEWTPFVKIIGRDLNRTFPEITMFQQKGGEGQNSLGRVLRAYSAYDMQVGYCQGLTFLAGPLLLHMGDRDAFCVLVKLMEEYDLRSMFTADMAGLQLRIFQFEALLKHYLPELNAHFEALGVNSIYASQWFLSFFAVTCPLSILVRIYDLMFAEGAIPTLMRVALAVLKRNQPILLDYDDDEQILQHLLGRNLWDLYGYEADMLVSGVNAFGPELLDKLTTLEAGYSTKGQISRARSVKKASASKKLLSGLTNWVGSMNSAATSTTAAAASTSTVSLATTATATTTSGSDLTRSNSIGSYVSDVSDKSAVTSITSYQSSTNAIVEEMQKKMDLMQHSLEASRQALETEQRLRLEDKEAVRQMLQKMELRDDADEEESEPNVVRNVPVVISTDLPSLEADVSQLRIRFGLDDGEVLPVDVRSPSATASCESCDKYVMDLAAARINEAMAKQEIDELKDKLYTLDPASSDKLEIAGGLPNSRSCPSGLADMPTESKHKPKKSWGLW